MRQVPASGTPPIGIVGDGRVARHFRHYLNLLGCPVLAWARRSSVRPPHEALAPCQTVLLLLRDGAIVPFIDLWPALREKQLVHCSGGLVTGAAQAAHPLMTFGHALYDLDVYRAIPFVVDSGGATFQQLLPGLQNPSFAIAAADRPYYHALCVMAGNFSAVLWLKLFDELQGRFGIPASAAQPYMKQVVANLLADGSRALTGPFARGDGNTIASNVKALDGDPFQAVYLAFAGTYAGRS
jgi:2-dehydropantoate 2-reductase